MSSEPPRTEDKRRRESRLVDHTRFPVLWSRYEATPEGS
jgi:hypothetical protein